MSNRWFASLLFVVAFSLPSHAYAEDGKTNVTRTLTDTVQQAEKQTIFSDSTSLVPRSAKDEPSTKSDSTSMENPVPAVKEQATPSADSLKVNVEKMVTEVAAQTSTVKASTTIEDVEVSADTQTINAEIPVAEVEVSAETAAVKVSTTLGSAEVSSDTQTIKAETPVTEAEVSAEIPAVKVRTPVVETELETKSPSVKVETPAGNPDVSLDLKEEQIEESDNASLSPILPEDSDHVSPIVPPEQKDESSITKPVLPSNTVSEKREQSPISIHRNLGQKEPSLDLTDKLNRPGRQFLLIHDNKNHVPPGYQPTSPITFYNGQGASCSFHIGNNTGYTSTGILVTTYLSEGALSNKMMEETKLHYDDWLNAPPTQPPQPSFFLQNKFI